jgi:hypothetical protein
VNLRSLGVRNYPLYLVGQLASLRGVDAVGGDRPTGSHDPAATPVEDAPNRRADEPESMLER